MNGNGNGDLSGPDFGGPDVPGADIPGPSDLPGFDVPGADIPGPSDYGPSGLFDIELSAYSPGPTPSPTEPSDLPDLSKAFSPASAVIEFEEGPELPSKFDISRVLDITGKTGLTIAAMSNPAFALAAGVINLAAGLFKEITGITFGQFVNALMGGEPAKGMEKGPMASVPSVRGTPITPGEYNAPKTEGLNLGLFSVPLSQKEPSSYYAKPSSVPLSMSLFGAKEGGGLMIFPTSAKGIEAEGSSLLKKQEPVIDTTSLLFLLGMGAVGMILRKGARA